MSKHPWEELIDSDEAAQALWEAKKYLKLAWGADSKDPHDFPINTAAACGKIEDVISELLGKKRTVAKYRRYREPKTLNELVSESTVRAMWELNHAGTFQEAMIRAAKVSFDDPQKSWKVFKGIVRAIETAYVFEFWGWETLPRPKVSILHRGLDQIAAVAGLEIQTNSGFATFLDDLCPCGLTDHRGAVRKMRDRGKRTKYLTS